MHLKQYKCKHVYGVDIYQKLIEAPEQTKTVPIGQKRKRGRPALARKALLPQ